MAALPPGRSHNTSAIYGSRTTRKHPFQFQKRNSAGVNSKNKAKGFSGGVSGRVRLSVSYGQDMFDQLGYPNIWLDIMANLQKWRHDIPDLPNVNFDSNPEESAEEIKDLPLRTFRKLFDDERIVSQILPVLFPTGATLAILEPYFRGQSLIVSNNIAASIHQYLKAKQEVAQIKTW